MGPSESRQRVTFGHDHSAGLPKRSHRAPSIHTFNRPPRHSVQRSGGRQARRCRRPRGSDKLRPSRPEVRRDSPQATPTSFNHRRARSWCGTSGAVAGGHCGKGVKDDRRVGNAGVACTQGAGANGAVRLRARAAPLSAQSKSDWHRGHTQEIQDPVKRGLDGDQF